MENSRDDIIQYIQGMPEDATIDDVMESLHFKRKVERGLRDIEEGRVLTHDEVKLKMKNRFRNLGYES